MSYEPHALAPLDFRTLLVESASGPHRIFEPLSAGDFQLSIQASVDHASTPRSDALVGDVSEWEVSLFRRGRWLGPDSAPEIFYDPIWTQFWNSKATTGKPVGQRVPTEVVQVFYDLLCVGRERYEQYLAYDTFLNGNGTSSPSFL